MSRLKLMVVGAGALGRHHVRILSGFDDVELIAVADPRPEVGRAVAEAHGSHWIPDFRTALDEVDAACVVVPTTSHWQVARELLDRGIPVLVEKPLTANISEAEDLVRLADERGAVLQVGHIERFNPAMKAARRVCGLPKYIRCERLSPFPFRSTDISVVHDVMIHDIDLVLELVRSNVTAVRAFGMGLMGAGEDIVQARLHFENGCIADLTASRLNPTAQRTMQIWSAINCVCVDFQSREVTSYAPSESLLFGPSPVQRANRPGANIEQLKQDVFGKLIRVEHPSVTPEDALTAELSEFVAAVRGTLVPSCDGHAALAALRIADQVLQATAQHQWGSPYQLRDVA